MSNAPASAVGYIKKATNTVNINISTEEDRIGKFARRKQMLNDNFYAQVVEELGNVMASAEDTGMIDQIDDTNNLFRMVIEELSKVYDNEPTREFSTNDADQKTMEELYEGIEVTEILEQSNTYMNAFNDVLVQVGYISDTQEFTLKLRTPENTIVVVDNDLQLEEVYIYGGKTDDDLQVWHGYTKENMFTLYVESANEVLGHVKDDRKPLNKGGDTSNPLGFLPFVSIHKGYRDDSFWQMYRGDDLVKGNIQVSIKLTILNQLIKFQSFKQLVATADSKQKLDGITIDPASVIYLFGENSDIKTLDLESNYKMLWDTIIEVNQNIATNYKISANMFKMTSTPSSGFALAMENLKLDGFIEKQQKYYKKVERDLYRLFKKIDDKLSLNKIKGDDLKVDFCKPVYPKSDKEILDETEKSIALGLTNQVEIIQDKKGVKKEEAVEIYEENIKYRNMNNENLNTPKLDETTTAAAMGLDATP